MTVHTGLEQAFQEADVILLLDDFSTQTEEESDEEKTQRVKETSERYRKYGRLIDERASKQAKVIVCGESSVNLRCSLLVENTPSIHSSHFVAAATQLEDEVRAVIAKEMKVRPSGEIFLTCIFCLYFSSSFTVRIIFDVLFFCYCRCCRCFCVGEH